MFEVLFIPGVLDVEVAVVGQEIFCRNFPGLVGFFTFLPPSEAAFECLELPFPWHAGEYAMMTGPGSL